MSDLTITNPFALMKLFIVLFHFLASTRGRYVSDSAFDLSVAAAEPRPVFLEPPEELQARVLPLVADNINFDDSPLSEASEKVEKILQRPLAFSYDQSSEASSTSSDEEEAEIVEVDQQPDAVDYYKHVKNVEPAESDEGGGSDGDKLEINEKHSEEEEEEEDHEPIKNADEDDNDGDQLDAPDLAEQKKIEDSDHKVSHLPIDEKKAEDSDYQDLEHHANHKKAEEGGGSAEDSDYQDSEHHANHKKTGGSGGGGGGSGGHKGAKEYKKGGGKEHHSSHKGEKGEKGDKGYKGHHYNEKGEKGHKTKEDHDKEYEEKGGHKKKHHHDDGYAAEHHQGEKGHKSSKYHENGDHSKGHSTKGEHIIHKKDEYDKRQEFYDESHEEDGFEKDGEYFHESDYKKGGHEKGGFVKGGEESAQHGKKHHYDKGGHYKEGKGHKGAAGHDSHYDHEHKKGEKEDNSGGKKWSYSKGDGGGGGGGHKHSGKYEHADSVNIPIRVVQPIIRHKDNDVQSNIPKLVLEEDVDNFKQPDVIYPPLTPHEFVRGQRRYDEDRIVISKPNHKKIVDERINIQRRNDEVDDANYEDEIINPELERKQAHTKDHSVFRSVLNRSTDNKIVDEADKKSKDLNTETTKFKSINSDYLDEYDLLDDKKNDEVGVYSVYTLGDYRLPAVPKIQPTTPATGTEGYEKLKDVAITSDSAEYSSSEETTTQNIQEELNRTILTDDDVDASKKVSKNIHDNKEIGPITAVSKDVEDIEEDEELRNVKDTDDNEELRNVKDTDDGEELTNVGDTKVLTASMEPIVVGDEVEEESEN